MCSSGAFLNFGHTSPKIRASKVWLNDVSGLWRDCCRGLLYRRDRSCGKRSTQQCLSR
ncbi:MAG: homocysteine biosynthesis protein [Candidatus Moduliflexus flocculans]|nr:homocysteine biosynthesis protein [Candidatus Moduliflexus flocculans]